MSKPKQTFKDPQTSEEIESTLLARGVVGLCFVLGVALCTALGLILGVALCGWLRVAPGYRIWLVGLLGAGLVGRLVFELIVPSIIQMHDGIARWQHSRRQRLLKRKLLEEEWAGVPDRALSRAQTPGKPTPTAASLSRAEAPEEETPRLAAGVDAAAEEEEESVVTVT